MSEGVHRCVFCQGFSEECPHEGVHCCARCAECGDGHDHAVAYATPALSDERPHANEEK